MNQDVHWATMRTVRPVKTGDVTFTPDNHGHGLKNTGDTDLVFMALIIFD